MSVPESSPSLKITGLHIAGYKALRKLDWPEDGLGWNGTIPDVVLVGGVNGSGKTTLLTTIVELIRAAFDPGADLPLQASTGAKKRDAIVRLHLAVQTKRRSPPDAVEVIAFAGDPPDILGFANAYLTRTEGGFVPARRDATVRAQSQAFSNARDGSMPGIVVLPSHRPLVLPPETFKKPGDLTGDQEFIHVFQPAAEWKDSLESLLYGLRWQDLNAKEEGRSTEANNFQTYADAFSSFYGGRKEVTWRGGELVVVLATGETHGLGELSSGEQQVIVIASELLRHWRPGSLILIDEPELHMHPQWQAQLWSLLVRWQKERGGQVIMTTQSNYLFGISDPGSHALLGMEQLG